MIRQEKEKEIPITEKINLTMREAVAYSNICRTKLYELTNKKGCPFVVWIDGKRLIRRKAFEEFVDKSVHI